jgi:hypothetical protein
MTNQEAIKPQARTSISRFAPHEGYQLRAHQPRFSAQVIRASRGPTSTLRRPTEGFVSAAQFDPDTGLIEVGCDPRGERRFPFAYAGRNRSPRVRAAGRVNLSQFER